MLVSQMKGGTLTPGVPPEVFAMSPGRRIRYDAPDPAIAPFVSGYAIYGHQGREPLVNWFLPAPAMISVVLDAGPLTASVRHNEFGPLCPVSLYGPTSNAFRMSTHGGIAVGIGISALGWARLASRSAQDFHNRVVPLAALLGHGLGEELLKGLGRLTTDDAIKPVLDRVLAARLAQPHPHRREALIHDVMALTVEDGIEEIGEAAARLGIPTHDLRRVAQRYFGMTPKLLLRRARFLRSFLRWADTGQGGTDQSWLHPSYFDVSHFLRDSRAFLGTTPRRFWAQETEFLRTSMRARAAVLGVGSQAFHDPDATPGAPTTRPGASRPMGGGREEGAGSPA
jgi:hypothetical protein